MEVQGLLFGQDHARASRSATPGSDGASLTSGTCGPSSRGSSPSVGPQLLLESRLRLLLDVDGSPEYALTWKRWDMSSSPPICALRASARRTFDNACGGWGSPQASDHKGSTQPGQRRGQLSEHALLAGTPSITICSASTDAQTAKGTAGWATPLRGDSDKHSPATHQTTLVTHALLAGYPTATVRDAGPGVNLDRPSRAAQIAKGHGRSILGEVAQLLAGYPTPNLSERGPESQASKDKRGSGGVDLQTTALGMTTSSSHAPTGKRGVLNPALARWLMGYPPAWCDCAVSAMPSCRKSRRRSSEPLKK
jgi:hypothetical protein